MKNTMKKPELLLPAGSESCLRAAVNNGADAVYLGLNLFNARESADNFNENSIHSAIKYCHDRNVKVYVALNTLVKNNELDDFFGLVSLAHSAEADAIIIQDPCFIPIIKKNFPDLSIHISTQTGITNSYAIPKGVSRVILPRELFIKEIEDMSKNPKGVETEVFVHGALCFCYSGMCLFSSMIGGRSGNRGRCAQPCRKIYNNKYLLSTKDLCMISEIPQLIKAGVGSLKVEGRLRSPLYVGTVARIYRKYIDESFKNQKKTLSIKEKDIDDLMIAFNREFTTGFGFNDSITDPRQPMNRGLYIGNIQDGKINLKKELKVGDGIAIWTEDKITGQKIDMMIIKGCEVRKAEEGDTVEIKLKNNIKDKEKPIPVYKTSSIDMKADMGDEIKIIQADKERKKISLPELKKKENRDCPKLFVKAYNRKSAIEADNAKADIIYYDIMKPDCKAVKESLKNSDFLVFTPKLLSDKKVDEVIDLIRKINPRGVLVSDKGLLKKMASMTVSGDSDNTFFIHSDYNLNCFNDIDIDCILGVPIISPELSLEEIKDMKNKNFIQLIHGDIVMMTAKEKLRTPELIDDSDRHFNVRKYPDYIEILNSSQLGLFNETKKYLEAGVKYFYIDVTKDVGKFTRIYKKILAGEKFDDSKIKKGYTTGHMNKGVE